MYILAHLSRNINTNRKQAKPGIWAGQEVVGCGVQWLMQEF